MKVLSYTLREEIFADEQFSDKSFTHFDPLIHFFSHFSHILTLFSQREKIIKFRGI